jgi:hypothetical protein
MPPSDQLSLNDQRAPVRVMPPSEAERLAGQYRWAVFPANTQNAALSSGLRPLSRTEIAGELSLRSLGGTGPLTYNVLGTGTFANASVGNELAVSPRSSDLTAVAALRPDDYSRVLILERIQSVGGRQQEQPALPTFRARITGPVRSLLTVFERWQISDQDAATLLGASSRSFVSDLRAGTASLASRDAQDRARLLLLIYAGVHSLLHTSEAERSWINSLLPVLDNQSIVDTMKRGSIADLMLIKEFVDRANGR